MYKTVVMLELLGETFSAIVVSEDDREVTFSVVGKLGPLTMFHQQDCCEDVYLSEVVGDLSDLIGEPLVEAEVVTESGDGGREGSCTWTFYKFGTKKGFVTLRWYGESNGYYSEYVSFLEITPNHE